MAYLVKRFLQSVLGPKLDLGLCENASATPGR